MKPGRKTDHYNTLQYAKLKLFNSLKLFSEPDCLKKDFCLDNVGVRCNNNGWDCICEKAPEDGMTTVCGRPPQ